MARRKPSKPIYIYRAPKTATAAKLGMYWTWILNDLLRDKSISNAARGLMCAVFTHAKSHRLTVDRLVAQTREGRTAVRAQLHELESAGYVTRHREQAVDGHWSTVFRFHERPVAESARTAPPRRTPK